MNKLCLPARALSLTLALGQALLANSRHLPMHTPGSLKGYAMAAVVCAAVAKQAQLCLESFKPHELSMMAWACPTMHGRKKSGNSARPHGAAALTWAAE